MSTLLTGSADRTTASLVKRRSAALALGAAAAALACALLCDAPLVAQTAQPGVARDEAADAIQCWWKTDKSAVTVGERFTLTLTCGVGAQVVPKTDALDPGALQLAPFDVLDGTRQGDIQAPPRRYFQYEYTLRLISQDYFGKDADIPSLTVTYNVQSTVAGASAGRDEAYVLPAIPIRILSLVPQNANDIRDSTGESSAEASTRLDRAAGEFVAAAVFFGFGTLMLAFAAVHVLRGIRRRSPARTAVLPEGTLVRACLDEMTVIKSEVAHAGWTPARAGSALTIVRVGSAVAIGRAVAQAPLDGTAAVREGQLAVRKGRFSRERVVVSAPTTPEAMDRYRTSGTGHAANGRLPLIEDLAESLSVFSGARYGRDERIRGENLDLALEKAGSALRRLRRTVSWPMRAAGAMAQAARTVRSSIWSR